MMPGAKVEKVGRGGAATVGRGLCPRRMRDSGVAWIGAIPEGWRVERLKNLFDFGKGLNITKADLVEEGVAVVSYGQIHSKKNDGVHLSQDLVRFVPRTYLHTDSAALLQEGDFAFADTSEDLEGLSNCVFIDKLAEVMAGYHTIVFRPREYANCKYLAFLFKSDAWRRQIRGMAYGIKVFSLTQRMLRECTVVLPPVSEQKAISRYLDTQCAEIDAAIASARQSIEDYKALKKSLVFEMVTEKRKVGGVAATTATTETAVASQLAGNRVSSQTPCRGSRGGLVVRPLRDSGVAWIGAVPDGWLVWPMKHLVDILPGYAFDSRDFAQQGTRLLREINVGVSTLRWDDTVYWNGPVPEEIKPYSLAVGDLVVGLDRPWISDGTRVTFVANSDLPCYLVQRVCRIRAKDGFDLRLARYWLASDAFQEALGCETTGVSVPHISTGQIGDFRIAIPPPLAQRAIADYLDEKCGAIDSLVAEKESLIADLEAYKKSLIFEVVTGKREVARV